MPNVRCTGCGAQAAVQFLPGTRLADQACPQCGSRSLHLPSHGQPGGSNGHAYEECALCGKRGLPQRRIIYPGFGWVPKHGPEGPFPAGSPCCWWHEPVPGTRVSHRQVATALSRDLGEWKGWASLKTEELLEKEMAPVPDECPACAGAGLEQRGFYTQVRAFARGFVLVAICNHCGHTTELGRLPREEVPGD